MQTQDPTPEPNQAAHPAAPAAEPQSPAYGEFGGVPASEPLAANHAAAPGAGRDGSNDNPDEFSELHGREQDAQNAPSRPADQPGHVEQNQDPAAVRATRDEDNDEQRNAWAQDDPRYAGGGTHNTRQESASTKDGQN